MERLGRHPPQQLEGELKEFYDYLDWIGTAKFKNAFRYKSERDGALYGPFGTVLLHPSVGRPYYELALALGELPHLPLRAREVAINAVGGHFQAEYQLYAHEKVGQAAGLSMQQINAIRGDSIPDGLQESEIVALEVARALCSRPGPLSNDLWVRALDKLGKEGALALIHYVGFYAYTSIMLNGVDAREPMED